VNPGSYQELEGWQILIAEHEEPEKIILAIEEASERLDQSLNGIF
jgi:hypothetical protein